MINNDQCDGIQLLSMSLYDRLGSMNAITGYAMSELDLVLGLTSSDDILQSKRGIIRQIEIFIDVFESLKKDMKISGDISAEMIAIVNGDVQ